MENKTETLLHSINSDSIRLLREKLKDDATAMQMLQDCLLSFMEYGSRIYRLEIYRLLFNYDNKNNEAFRQELMSLDRSRTMGHDSVISNLDILNRFCDRNGIPPVYDEIISTERPYRVEIADAVLAYAAQIIEARPK
jgi:hypothetical protein